MALFHRMAEEKKAIPGSRIEERLKENAGAADIILMSGEVTALDEALDAMEMSDVFGGSRIKKD